MIKTYYECDACGDNSFNNDFLTTVQVEVKRFVGYNASTKTTVVALCSDCMLSRCGIEMPEKGEPYAPVINAMQEPGAAERLVLALNDFIQESLQ